MFLFCFVLVYRDCLNICWKIGRVIRYLNINKHFILIIYHIIFDLNYINIKILILIRTYLI